MDIMSPTWQGIGMVLAALVIIVISLNLTIFADNVEEIKEVNNSNNIYPIYWH